MDWIPQQKKINGLNEFDWIILMKFNGLWWINDPFFLSRNFNPNSYLSKPFILPHNTLVDDIGINKHMAMDNIIIIE